MIERFRDRKVSFLHLSRSFLSRNLSTTNDLSIMGPFYREHNSITEPFYNNVFYHETFLSRNLSITKSSEPGQGPVPSCSQLLQTPLTRKQLNPFNINQNLQRICQILAVPAGFCQIWPGRKRMSKREHRYKRKLG